MAAAEDRMDAQRARAAAAIAADLKRRRESGEVDGEEGDDVDGVKE